MATEFDAEFDAGFESESAEFDADVKSEDSQGQARPEEVLDTGGREESKDALLEREAGGERRADLPEQGKNDSAPKFIEAPDNIQAELEELKKLNPEAASLALEDSADGLSIRRRLENYGAEQAQDRAEMLLERRERASEAQRLNQARIEAANRDFQATIKRDAPDYYRLVNDPARQEEARRYIQKLDNWIQSRPMSEGMKLMRIRNNGTASEVCSLIHKFEAEANGKRADATGGLAFHSRGVAYPAAGIGDKDDFDAGWQLNA